MTHFVVTVVLPKGVEPLTDRDANELIADLLAPYDENTQVDPYETECHCVGWTKNLAAWEASAGRYGKIDDLRESFKSIEPQPAKSFGEMTIDELEAHFEEESRLWQEHIHLKERRQIEADIKASMPDEPDPDCEQCNGTGKHMSTYNPKSRWDWYSVGGRWNCSFFENTNIKQVRDIKPTEIASHIVTPDGEWHARGQNGWWGTFSEEITKEDWYEKTVKPIFSEVSDHFAVVVDAHI